MSLIKTHIVFVFLLLISRPVYALDPPAVNSSIVENTTVNTNSCTQRPEGLACSTNMQFSLVWSKSSAYPFAPPSSIGYWSGSVIGVSDLFGSTTIGQASNYQGRYIFRTVQGPLTEQQRINERNIVNAAHVRAFSNFVNPDGSVVSIQSIVPAVMYQTLGNLTTSPAPTDQQTLQRGEHQQQCAGDPVYIHSGQFSYECSDFQISGRQLDLELTHSYFSGLSYNGPFGFGWSINYHMRLHRLRSGNVILVSGDGRKTEYVLSAGVYQSPFGRFENLQKNPDNSWTLTQAQGEQYLFDADGKLTSMKDRNGNSINLNYDLIRQPYYGRSKFAQNPLSSIALGLDDRLTQVVDTTGRQINFTYNASGLLSAIVNGPRQVGFTYDSDTNDLLGITKPSTVQFPNGLTKSFTYENHNVKKIRDPRGQYFVENFYDTQGRVNRQNLGGFDILFDYSIPNQTTVTDRKGFVTQYGFNTTGNVIRKEEFTASVRPSDPGSFITNYTYNLDMLMLSQTNPRGNGVKYVYDSSNTDFRKRGNLLSLRQKTDMAAIDNDTNDLLSLMTYDANFNQIKTTTDANGNVTIYTYDYELPPNHPKYNIKGDLIYVDEPAVAGGTPRFEMSYNPYGQPTQIIDPNGNITQLEYFPATGYLNKIRQDPTRINAVTQKTYDQFGLPNVVTDPNGRITDYDYNELGWLLQEKNPRNLLTKYTHDENGNVIKIERQLNQTATQWQTTQMSYDILNHLVTQIDPLTRTTTFTYDNNENPITKTDALNNTTTKEYDERNLLFKIKDANSPQGITQYDYDPNSNLKTITDANNHTTSYSYDLFDRKTGETLADNKIYSFTYDKNSNLLELIKPSTVPAATITNSYDALNRLTNKTYPTAALNASYFYDLGSRLVDANTAAASHHFVYDRLNRKVSNTQTLAGMVGPTLVLSYAYDKAGNVSVVKYPGDKKIGYGYDANDNLTDIKTSDSFSANYKYDLLDRVNSRIYNLINTQSSGYGFDLANQLRAIKTGTTSDLISYYEYPSYDQAGNRKQVKTQGAPGSQTINYNYNNIYELTSVTGSQSHNYAYDNVNNRQSADEINYQSNEVNQYTTVGLTNYTYDDNGNLTYDGRNIYAYDEENRLSTVQGTSLSAQYAYDAFNRRISKTINGTTTFFISNNDQEVEERSAAGTLLADYIYGNNLDEVLTMTRGNNKYYYHHDGLGSVTEVTKADGTIAEKYTYDPYGNPTIRNAAGDVLQRTAIGNSLMFTGRRFDEESGLYHYRARTYNSSIGRYLQHDPIGFYDSMNLYQFVLNNPINNIDPFGLDVWIEGYSPNAPKDDREPLPHQSINVGDPNSIYYSYSFGINSDAPFSSRYLINGIVYRDPYGGGKIDKNHYLRTTVDQDKKAKEYLDSLVGMQSTYCLIGANCRDFSKMTFKIIKEEILKPCS